MDRAAVFYTVGWGFESLLGGHIWVHKEGRLRGSHPLKSRAKACLLAV